MSTISDKQFKNVPASNKISSKHHIQININVSNDDNIDEEKPTRKKSSRRGKKKMKKKKTEKRSKGINI